MISQSMMECDKAIHLNPCIVLENPLASSSTIIKLADKSYSVHSYRVPPDFALYEIKAIKLKLLKYT
jgi:hypothetical protein